ncbi:MAG: hypothetical protein R3C59_03350 [Planctomycetaceae bacterium]
MPLQQTQKNETTWRGVDRRHDGCPLPRRMKPEFVSRILRRIMKRCTIWLTFVLMLAECRLCNSAVADDTSGLSLGQLVDRLPVDYVKLGSRVAKSLVVYEKAVEGRRSAARVELQMRLGSAIRAYGEASHNAIAVAATLDWLNGDGPPPNDVDAIKWIVSYADGIFAEQQKVLKSYSALVRKMTRDGRTTEVGILNAAVRRLEAIPKKDDQVLVGRVFKGYRTTTDGKALIPLLIRIETGTDESFYGKLEKDHMYSGHPVHEATGCCQGTSVNIQTGKLLEFGNNGDHAWTYGGMLFNRTIIGRYAGRDTKGRPKGGVFVVRFGR